MDKIKLFFIVTLYIFLTCLCFQSSFAVQIQNTSEDFIIYENWLSIQESVHKDSTNANESIYDRLSEKYFLLYKATGNRAYLNFSFYEAGRSKRGEIIERLTTEEIESIQNLIKVLNKREITSEYYSLKPFSYEGIYKFTVFDIPPELKNKAKELLDYWLENLPTTYKENSTMGSLQAQALIYGYNRYDDFQKVFEVGQYLIKSNPFPESFFKFNLFNTIAYSARIRGYYTEALRIYENTLLPLALNLEESNIYLTTIMDYALTLFRIGNVNAALEEFENIYAQGIQNLNSRYRPALLNNLAISYLNSGQFDRYVQFQLEAFEIAREEENFDQQLEILRNLFIFYRRQNETELALNYLNQALELSQQYNIPEETAGVLLSLGVYKREEENLPREALAHFYEALELSQESDSYQQNYNSYIELAETYHELDEIEKADNYFNEAIALSNSRNDERSNIMAHVRYGNMLVDNESFEEAGVYLDNWSATDLHQIPFDIRVLGNNVIIKLLKHDRNINQAIKISSSIVEEILSWLQESTDLQTGHMRMDEEFTETFRLHTELLYETGDFDEAIAVTGELRNLSRTGFYNNPLLKSQILSEEELIQDYNLSNRIQDLRNRYENANAEQRVYLGNELVNSISERNSLQNNAFPNYADNEFQEILPLAMKKLKSDQMVIYFSVFENQIFQFFVSRNNIDMKAYPAEDKYLDLLENAVSTFGHASTDLNQLHDVYTTFYEENIPNGINHIYVIPDGIFYRLPIEILPVEPVQTSKSYGSSTYLIEKYSVSYLNTLSDLITESPESNFSFDMAGFGVSNFAAAGHPELPDLPFSPREITESAKKLEKFTNNRFFINDQSTEANFRDIAGKARVIHLATHSKVDDESPLFSSLYLHTGTAAEGSDSLSSNNDGIMHAYELFDLNLNADLIFLSSCESGTGGYLKGSGILGFSRAFTYAGAQSLSINLWPIRDQTASEISLKFYEALNEGKNKADALREARLSYLNNSNSDPYLWGAFIMYGNIDSPINNNTFFAQLLISGLLLTGLFFVAIFVYQKKSYIRSWIL